VDFPGDWSTTQLVGNDITADAVLHVLEGVTTIYTFNGAGFDLPFLAWKPGVDLRRRFEHQDLMRVSRRAGLKGGLKVIEKALGIPRNLPDMRGYDAVLLWEKYLREDNPSALEMLLEYNREDVENLRVLRNKLEDENWNLD
jgi:uncharacterized protein YprB with RNaseH-like and TPR domain